MNASTCPIRRLLVSSLGRKYLMAFTGFCLVSFLIIHMIGNLKIFLGADDINHYAVVLKSRWWVLWGFRLGLLGIAVIHIVTAISLAIENKMARPQSYGQEATIRASWASLTMVVSGVILALFIIFHILHFTTKTIFPEYHHLMTSIRVEPGIFQTLAPVVPHEKYHDVYRMMVDGFRRPWISIFYIFSMGLVGLHLSHGIQSMFQSLGCRNDKVAWILHKVSILIALVFFVGMSAVPVSVWMGWIKS